MPRRDFVAEGKKKRRIYWVAFSLIVLFAAWCWPCAPVGRFHAHLDWMLGVPVYHIYGMDELGDFECKRLLKQRYGVEMYMSGCKTNENSISYGHAYNEVLSANLKRKYGRDVIAECRNDGKAIASEKIHREMIRDGIL